MGPRKIGETVLGESHNDDYTFLGILRFLETTRCQKHQRVKGFVALEACLGPLLEPRISRCKEGNVNTSCSLDRHAAYNPDIRLVTQKVTDSEGTQIRISHHMSYSLNS